MDRYVVLEIGESAYTEFRKKDGEYESTDDAILVGIVDGISNTDAIRKACALDYCKDREFDMLVAYRLA